MFAFGFTALVTLVIALAFAWLGARLTIIGCVNHFRNSKQCTVGVKHDG